MAERLRHILATLAAALAFPALYLGLSLQAWLVLVLAAAIYLALLLIIPAHRDPARILVADRVSEADLRHARAALAAAIQRLTARAESARQGRDRDLVGNLAANISALDRALADDPGDLVQMRRFITAFLPRMVETVDSYLRLEENAAQPEALARLQGLRGVLETYPGKVAALTDAALNRDLRALEAEVEALSFQLGRGRGAG